MDIDPYRIVTHPIAAGIGGAIAGLKFAPGPTWLDRVFNVAAGAASASWLAPAAAGLFDLPGLSSEAALSFVIGMLGMSVAAAIVETLRTVKWADIITGWISRK